MSVFERKDVKCPACGEVLDFGVNYSLNADRRPDFRQQIIDGSFQRKACDKCGESFRMEPEMTYMDMGRGQLILVLPNRRVEDWDALEEAAIAIHSELFGPDSSDDAQEMGRQVTPRVTFGWGALREKILCSEYGINDISLELAKLAILAELEDPPLNDRSEFRLGKVDDQLHFGWITTGTEALLETISVPKTLLAEIEANSNAWEAAKAELMKGPYVDMQRLLIPSSLDLEAAAAEVDE